MENVSEWFAKLQSIIKRAKSALTEVYIFKKVRRWANRHRNPLHFDLESIRTWPASVLGTKSCPVSIRLSCQSVSNPRYTSLLPFALPSVRHHVMDLLNGQSRLRRASAPLFHFICNPASWSSLPLLPHNTQSRFLSSHERIYPSYEYQRTNYRREDHIWSQENFRNQTSAILNSPYILSIIALRQIYILFSVRLDGNRYSSGLSFNIWVVPLCH
jgi:hypothetical protein